MYDGGEIVRLKNDHPDYGLQAGDCGVIWGVYNVQVFDLHPPVYEATFHNLDSGDSDFMFNAEDVELVNDPEQAPCSAWVTETRRIIKGCEAA